MVKSLKLEDILENIQPKIYTQDYSSQPVIERVQIINLSNHLGEEGDLSEIARIDSNGDLEYLPGFRISQINRTKLSAGSLKAWHLHFEQDEIWYLIPSGQLLVGLWDVRRDSPTKNKTMRIILGGGASQLLLIPKGVAHGSVNLGKESVELFYFINHKFDPKNPDEKRINWDALGKEFWTPIRD